MSNPLYRHGWFPFPIAETTTASDVGIGTPFPLGMTLEAAVELFWRAKTIKITCAAHGTMPAGSSFATPDYPTTDYIDKFTSADFTWNFIKLDEINALDTALDTSNQGDSTDTGDNPSITEPGQTPPAPPDEDDYFGTYTASQELLSSLFLFTPSPVSIGGIFEPRMVKYNGLYYPTMIFSILLEMNEGFAHVPPEVSPPAVDYSVGYSSLDFINGGSFPLSIILFGTTLTEVTLASIPIIGGGVGGPITQTYTGLDSIELEIVEWWPFNPNDGLGPFYNTTTGELLR